MKKKINEGFIDRLLLRQIIDFVYEKIDEYDVTDENAEDVMTSIHEEVVDKFEYMDRQVANIIKGCVQGKLRIDRATFENRRNKLNMDKKKLYESIMKNVAKEVKKALKEGITYMDEKEDIWLNLVEYGVATEEELKLVTDLMGYSVETLNKVLYARTGYHDWEQYSEAEL